MCKALLDNYTERRKKEKDDIYRVSRFVSVSSYVHLCVCVYVCVCVCVCVHVAAVDGSWTGGEEGAISVVSTLAPAMAEFHPLYHTR